MNIEKASKIFGWQEPEELEWLAFEAARHERIIEIGSFQGRSTRVLGDNTKGTVWAVDHWNGPKEISPPIFDPVTLWPSFTANLSDLIATGKVVPYRSESIVAAKKFLEKHGQTFDMVFIDASHDLESVTADIQYWSMLLKPGGLLCGHDSQWPGVMEARRLMLPPHMTGVGGIWAVDNFQGLRI